MMEHRSNAQDDSRPRSEDIKSTVLRELINANQLADMLSISERTLYRLKSMGQLPKPIVLGGSVRWRLTVVRDWIANGCPTPSVLK